MRTVKVKYFASLREEAKTGEEEVTVEARTYGDLYEALRRKHGFTLPVSQIQLAVNDEFASLDAELTDHARVVFIPPIAGG